MTIGGSELKGWRMDREFATRLAKSDETIPEGHVGSKELPNGGVYNEQEAMAFRQRTNTCCSYLQH